MAGRDVVLSLDFDRPGSTSHVKVRKVWLISLVRMPMKGDDLRSGSLSQLIKVTSGAHGPTGFTLPDFEGVTEREFQPISTAQRHVPLWDHEILRCATSAGTAGDYSPRDAGNHGLGRPEQRTPCFPLVASRHRSRT